MSRPKKPEGGDQLSLSSRIGMLNIIGGESQTSDERQQQKKDMLPEGMKEVKSRPLIQEISSAVFEENKQEDKAISSDTKLAPHPMQLHAMMHSSGDTDDTTTGDLVPPPLAHEEARERDAGRGGAAKAKAREETRRARLQAEKEAAEIQLEHARERAELAQQLAAEQERQRGRLDARLRDRAAARAAGNPQQGAGAAPPPAPVPAAATGPPRPSGPNGGGGGGGPLSAGRDGAFDLAAAEDAERPAAPPPTTTPPPPFPPPPAAAAIPGPAAAGAAEGPTLMEQMVAAQQAAKKEKVGRKVEEEKRMKKEFGGGFKKGFFNSGSKKTKSSSKKSPVTTGSQPKNTSPIQTLRPKTQQTAAEKKDPLVLPEVQSRMQATGPDMTQIDPKTWATPELLAQLAARPDLARAFADPRFLALMQEMQTNPEAAKKKLQDMPEAREIIAQFAGIMGSHFDKLGDEQEKKGGAREEGGAPPLPTPSPPPPKGPLAEKALRAHQDGTAEKMRPQDDKEQAAVDRVLGDPELRALLMDPGMQAVLQECGDPRRLHHYLRDPEISPKIVKLADAGLVQIQR